MHLNDITNTVPSDDLIVIVNIRLSVSRMPDTV
jgi:hypothetical protein